MTIDWDKIHPPGKFKPVLDNPIFLHCSCCGREFRPHECVRSTRMYPRLCERCADND